MRPEMLELSKYVDHEKIPKLVSLAKELFEKIDLEPFKVDVGKKNVGTSIRWYSVIIVPHKTNDVHYVFHEELESAAKDLICHARSMQGLERLALNILEPCSVVPIHYDNESDSDDRKLCPFYNILVPLDSNGYSIVNNKLIKNEDGQAIIFDPQSQHGAMNDTLEIRRNFFIKVRNEAFNYDSTK